MGADPGALKLKDGGWLLAVTGPPREGRRQNAAAPGADFRQEPRPPVVHALDANSDGTIDQWELQNATALLRKLDRNADGRLTPDELRPARMERGREEREEAPRRPGQPRDR